MQDKIKCRDFNACNTKCLECNLILNKQCDKIFDFEIPTKFVTVERKDCGSISWNECPTCRYPIGYTPKLKNFKCKRCGQIILWK